jgi:hypothetical protein
VNGNGNPEDLMSPLRRQMQFLETEIEQAKIIYSQTKTNGAGGLEVSSRLKIVTDLISKLQALTKIAPELEQQSKNVLMRVEVEQTWGRFLKELRSQLDALPRRVALHPMFKKIDPVAVEKLLNEERNRVLMVLSSGGWRAAGKKVLSAPQ